jgi:natural product precursor
MKKKLNNKLSLKKETLGSLNADQMNNLKGGGTRDSTCGCGTTGTTGASCWCTVTVVTLTVCTCA